MRSLANLFPLGRAASHAATLKTGAAGVSSRVAAPVALLNPRAVQPVTGDPAAEIIRLAIGVAWRRTIGVVLSARLAPGLQVKQVSLNCVFHALTIGMGKLNERGSMVQELGSGREDAR